MATKASAGRYAQAVFEIALERQELDKWRSDLETIAALGEDPALADLLENPRLRLDDKTKLLASVLKDISPLALNLVYLLVAKNRLNLAPDIAVHYQQMLDSYQGIERADVVTAVPLDEEGKRSLEARLGAMINKKVIIREEIDPDLLGGVIARIGGKLLDGSVRSRLAALKAEIARTAG
ncbi:MAG: F0F1 ATP synthase subunit delta [Chloroflexi bacterium]|nr:F0F1 ATP synthase subunit delta [Chloroflexota bacterium]